MKRLSLLSSIFCAALFLAACGGTTETAKKAEPEPPPEPASGREAYQKMYLKARLWSNDAELLKLQSVSLDELPDQGGKTGAWQAQFASPSKRRVKTITYSVIEGPGNLHKGVFEGSESSFSGDATQLIAPVAIKIDSTQAHETAMEHAKDYMKKNPDMAIFYVLEIPVGARSAQWRVIWGRSLATSNFSIYVDAATGQYLKTMH